MDPCIKLQVAVLEIIIIFGSCLSSSYELQFDRYAKIIYQKHIEKKKLLHTYHIGIDKNIEAPTYMTRKKGFKKKKFIFTRILEILIYMAKGQNIL